MNRRNFLRGMAGILASGMAPAVIGSGVLMPVRTIWKPDPALDVFVYGESWSKNGIRIIPYDVRDEPVAKILEGLVNRAHELTGLPPPMLLEWAQRTWRS